MDDFNIQSRLIPLMDILSEQIMDAIYSEVGDYVVSNFDTSNKFSYNIDPGFVIIRSTGNVQLGQGEIMKIIKSSICIYYETEWRIITSKTQIRKFCEMRQMAQVMALKFMNLSLSDIGKLYNVSA